MESILTSIKKLLGISEDYTQFDSDIIMHINTVLMDLNGLGVGPSTGFVIEDDTTTWIDFISNPKDLQAVKSYMYLRVKLLFDSATLSSAVISSMEKQIEKFEWLLNVAAENKKTSGVVDENVSEEIQALIAQLESENEELKLLNSELATANTTLTTKVSTLEKDKAALEADNADLHTANNSLLTRNENLETQNGELLASNEALENQLEELETSIKPEQEKAVTIAENGTVDVIPDDGKTLSKVAVTVEVPSSGEDDFVGIKYSNYTGDTYNVPKTADARSLDKQPTMISSRMLQNTFSNQSINPNGGYFAFLEEVYLPERAAALYSTFENCAKLTTIHGSLSKIGDLDSAFKSCISLDINAVIARMSNLKIIGNNSFYGCTQITEITLSATITSIHTGAFSGCTNIEKVAIPEGWSISLYFQHTNNLTQESLHAMIENLADMSESTSTKYFRVGPTNIAKIDEEHIAMLNTKNWNYS